MGLAGGGTVILSSLVTRKLALKIDETSWSSRLKPDSFRLATSRCQPDFQVLGAIIAAPHLASYLNLLKDSGLEARIGPHGLKTSGQKSVAGPYRTLPWLA